MGLENLKILSLGRNIIKKLEALDPVAPTLEELWISYNLLEKFVSSQLLTQFLSIITLLFSHPKLKCMLLRLKSSNKINMLRHSFILDPIYMRSFSKLVKSNFSSCWILTNTSSFYCYEGNPGPKDSWSFEASTSKQSTKKWLIRNPSKPYALNMYFHTT